MSKVMGILSNFGLLYMPAHQIWSCHVTMKQILKSSKTFLVQELSVSYVIRQNLHGGGSEKHPPLVSLGLNAFNDYYKYLAVH